MSTNFDSPQKFLEYLQHVYARKYHTATPDIEFKRRTNEEAKEQGLDLKVFGPYGYLERIVEELKGELFGSIDTHLASRINQEMALGLLPNGEANAFIARSRNRHYALLFNSGLMIFLHKYLKLIRASLNPADVVYCNRKEATQVTRDDIKTYVFDLIDIYKAAVAPYGPMVKLSRQATAEHSLLLHLSELFTICHELGHYLNGDLEHDSWFSVLPGLHEAEKFEENQDHEMEYAADATGYGLYLKAIKKQGLDPKTYEVIIPVIGLFNLFYALAGGASSTHPHPYDRIINIAHRHYGQGFANEVEEALENPSLLPSIFVSKKMKEGK